MNVPNLRPEELDLEGALRRLFPGGISPNGVPRRTWDAGRLPTLENQDPRSALAEWIAKPWLGERLNASSVQVLDAGRLAEKGISCPLFHVLLSIAYAADTAMHNEVEYFERRRSRENERRRPNDKPSSNAGTDVGLAADRQTEWADLAADAAHAISLFLRQGPPWLLDDLSRTHSRFGHPKSLRLKQTGFAETQSKCNSIASAMKHLEKFANDLKATRDQYVSSNKPDVWAASFVVQMRYVYCEITDRQPAISGSFPDFVAYSYAALGGNRSEWTRAIKNARDDAPVFMPDGSPPYSPASDVARFASEVASMRDVDPAVASLLSQAVEEPETGLSVELNQMCLDGTLPRNIVVLIRRMTWGADGIIAGMLGLSENEVADTKARWTSRSDDEAQDT